MGSGQLPAGVEACLTAMTRGERCVFVVPAHALRPEAPPEGGKSGGKAPPAWVLPLPPNNAAQVWWQP
jgi:hypothetical protein